MLTKVTSPPRVRSVNWAKMVRVELEVIQLRKAADYLVGGIVENWRKQILRPFPYLLTVNESLNELQDTTDHKSVVHLEYCLINRISDLSN
jgi:hypothetical protein